MREINWAKLPKTKTKDVKKGHCCFITDAMYRVACGKSLSERNESLFCPKHTRGLKKLMDTYE